MNKKTIITALLALVALTGQSQENNYTIHGDMSKAIEEAMTVQKLSLDSVIVVNPATTEQIAKQACQNGKFTIHGTVEKPFFAELYMYLSALMNGEKQQRDLWLPVIIEPGNIVFDANGETPVIRGTPLNDMVYDLFPKGSDERPVEAMKELVVQHKNDAVAIPLLLMMENAAEPDTLLSLIGQCSEDVQRHPHIVKMKEKVKAFLTQLGIGNMFKDFAVEYNGKTTRLSDYVGRGQYVFVDFWASWCGPCIAEIPHVIAAYDKYKDKGLQVLGVAVWDKPDRSEAAIKELGISYPQIINAQDIATTAYGIKGIPETILFAPDGTIVARGLRGEDIEKKLAEIFARE